MALGIEIGLGVAFTMIALAPMVPDWIRNNPLPETKINVMVGLPKLTPEEQGRKEEVYGQLSFGGCAPAIGLFNANGDRIGYYDNDACDDVDEGNHVDQNAPKDLMAKYIKPGSTEKTEYITVSAAGIDAICISAITVTFPSSSDIYAFLPGEVAAVCREYDPVKHDYQYSDSEATVQFKDPNSQKTQIGRPRCLWIDKSDKDGLSATKWQGFQVHLPDFKLDNSTFKGWEEDPGQMCNALARFSGYEVLNHMMCPQVFSPAPMAGEALPLQEITPCLPGVVKPSDGRNNGKPFTTPCDDTRLTFQYRYNIIKQYGRDCRWRRWYGDCEDSRIGCPADGEGLDDVPDDFQSEDARDTWTPSTRHRRSCFSSRKQPRVVVKNTEFVTDDDFPTEHHPLQKRFAGMLVKSRDVTQSAERACTDSGMVGPDIYDHKGMFCDMVTRKLYPTCKSERDVECFDPALNVTRSGQIEKRAAMKKYVRIRDLY
ncbi:uncharacterized protein EI97DRAFT_444160 [Westerdykella ornata]|uniref:Uncharacterized protein n=1 Tax=Westerdykella ornata TaxID=318751 RepID=A0A6A6JDR5_WESOR|nr:uncharacterized protein EI97DRAFT_444160 [Westerdykella ornata]KAF2274415.1 hypothetical protein EI97DRAFT_444160 [Westerdykella ornata]